LRDDTGRSAKSTPYRVAALLFASVSLAILVLAYFERPVESSIALVTVAAGIPFYLGFAKAKRLGFAKAKRQGLGKMTQP